MKCTSIDQYLAEFNGEVKSRLEAVRAAVQEAAPDAKATIGYNIPAFELGGILVYFAAFKKHLGFYPMPETIACFQERLSEFQTAEGTVKFPHDKPIPLDLIRDMVAYRVGVLQNSTKAK